MHPSHRSSLRPLFLLPTWLLAAAAHAANSVEAAAVPDDPAAAQAPARALSLAEAEATALRQQPLMRQSRGQTSAAEGRVEQARAGYLPQVSASALYERTTANPAVHPGFANNVSATLAPTSTKTFNFFNFGINGSQLIYDFGQTDGRWRSQEASRDAAQANERTTEAQALLTVRRAYFQARAQRDLAEVAAATVKNQERHLHQIEAFVRAGIRPDIDLAQARTDLANAKVQLVTGTNNVAVSQAQLRQAMGVVSDGEQAYQLGDVALPAVAGEDGPLGPLIDAAVGARPELSSIQRQRRAQELLVSALRGGYGPSLSAIASVTDVGVQVDHLTPNWFGGLSLSWPILQGGFTRGQIHEATGTLDSLAAQEDVLRLQVRVDVEAARLGVRAAKATITAAEEALLNAREQLRLAEGRYANGIGSVIELGDSQIAFSNASAQSVQARFGLSTARAQLLAATGIR